MRHVDLIAAAKGAENDLGKTWGVISQPAVQKF